MGVPPPAYQPQSDQSFPQVAPDSNPLHPQPSSTYSSPQTVQYHQPATQGFTPKMAYQGQGQQMGGPHPVPLASLLDQPNWVQCPSCSQVNMDRLEFVSGTRTHLWALAFCCCIGLCCIPYCVSGMKDVEHHCSSCGTLLATYKRGSGTEVHAGPQAMKK